MNELEIYTETIRAKYNEIMRTRKPWHKDVFCPEHFEKAASLCLRLKALPEEFVAIQFRGLVDIEKFHPGMLYGKYAEQRYIDGSGIPIIETTPPNYEGSLQAQIIWLQDLIQTGYTVEDALKLEDIQFSHWFRILITKEADIELLKKYKEKASEELQNNPDLLEFLKTKKDLDIKRIF